MSETPQRRTAAILLGVLVLAVFAAFLGVAGNGFISIDDPEYVVDNPLVHRGLTSEGWRYAWSSGDAANWHPLTWLSHMLDVELFGLDAGRHHLSNLALHALNAAILFALVLRWTKNSWPAVFIAALFALHPLRVESVAWAAERKDVLSATFFFATLHAWTSFVRSSKPAHYALAILCCALGLLAKPILVTLPFLLLVLDGWPFGRLARGWRALALEKLPFLALAIASSLTTFAVQRAWGAVATQAGLPMPERVANALVSYVRYLQSTVWPVDLAAYYPHAMATDRWPVLVAVALLALVTWWCWRARSRSPWLLAGWLWYVGMCVPVIGIVQVGMQSHADRYTYLPTIGIVLAIVLEFDARLRASSARRVFAALTLVALSLLAWRTREQVALWKNTRTLLSHTLAVTRDNPLARQHMANERLRSGDVEGAIVDLTECVRIQPLFPDALNNLGAALGARRRYPEAVERFREAIRLGLDSASVRTNLGWTLLQQGKFDEAELECRRAVEMDPENAQAHERLGVLLGAVGRSDEALAEIAESVRLEPDGILHRRALALTLQVAGRDAESAAQYQAALALDAADVECLKGLAWLRATSFDGAVRDPGAARELSARAAPLVRADDARFHEILAAALAASGEFENAVADAERAAELYRSQARADKQAELAQQLELYRSKQPFVRPAPAR